ncbi:MAG: ATPase, partial [Paracoccaceae bacterium]
RLLPRSVRATAQAGVEHDALPPGVHPASPAFLRARPDLLETTADTLQRGQVIACTPRSWARVSAVLGAVSDRRLRDVMIAGTVGEAPAAEFALVLADIAASVRVDEMIAASPAERWALYPGSLHGLTALTYALIGAAEEKTLAPVIALMASIAQLHRHRDDPALRTLPLAELCTHGFELLLQKALHNGWEAHFAASPDWVAYAKSRAQQAGV